MSWFLSFSMVRTRMVSLTFECVKASHLLKKAYRPLWVGDAFSKPSPFRLKPRHRTGSLLGERSEMQLPNAGILIIQMHFVFAKNDRPSLSSYSLTWSSLQSGAEHCGDPQDLSLFSCHLASFAHVNHEAGKLIEMKYAAVGRTKLSLEHYCGFCKLATPNRGYIRIPRSLTLIGMRKQKKMKHSASYP